MAVRIRMKKMGRAHRPYFRIVAMDKRSPRDGRVIEELGTYDPMCPETDARTTLKAERIDYWIGVGAQPSDKVAVLIKKYGTDGTHLKAREEALERLGQRKNYTPAPEPVKPAKKKQTEEAEDKSGDEPAAEGAAEGQSAEATSEEAPSDQAVESATEEATTEEAKAE